MVLLLHRVASTRVVFLFSFFFFFLVRRNPRIHVPPTPPGVSGRALLVEAATIQRIEHIAVGGGAAVGIAGIQHVPHIQAAARRAGRRGWGRCHTALRWLHWYIRRVVGRGGMACIIRVRLRRVLVVRWRVVGAWSGVRLVSGRGARGRNWCQVGWVRVLKPRS